MGSNTVPSGALAAVETTTFPSSGPLCGVRLLVDLLEQPPRRSVLSCIPGHPDLSRDYWAHDSARALQQARSRSYARMALGRDVMTALGSCETVEEYEDGARLVLGQRLLDMAREAASAGVIVDVRRYVAA